jgi:Uma2 family endonuclease
MSAVIQHPMTLEAFLAWEERQSLRYEFDGFAPVAMTGGTVAHAAIQRNLAIAIGSRLRGRACQYFGSDLKIKVDGRVRYPDGMVVCSAQDTRATIADDPVVVFEVLSDSTARTDTIAKNHEYAATKSIRRYVILSQDEPAGTMFERIGENWVGSLLMRLSVLTMPEIDIDMPLSEFYEGVKFAPNAEIS